MDSTACGEPCSLACGWNHEEKCSAAPGAHACRQTDSWACKQVTTRLKLGVMWDHNGTYMDGFGFQYRDQQVLIELDETDEIKGVRWASD